MVLGAIWSKTSNESSEIKTEKTTKIATKQPVSVKKIIKPKEKISSPDISKPNDITLSFLEQSNQCQFYALHNDSAVIVAEQPDDIRVSEVTPEGIKLSIKLPFYPTTHTYFNKREDGTLLSLFSDLRLNSTMERAKDTNEPVRVYLDEDMIFSSPKALDVGMASNGSSFYVIQPTDDNTTELFIHNLDLDLTFKYDISHLYGYTNTHPFFTSRFTLTNDAIWFIPAEETMENQTHHLFPTNGSAPQSINVNFGWDKSPVFYTLDKAVILTSNTNKNKVSLQVVNLPKYIEEFEASEPPKNSLFWAVDLPGYSINSQSVSTYNGELLLEHEGIRVFDIVSGKVNFILPNNEKEQRARLNWGHDLGRIVGAQLSNKGIILLRKIGLEHLDRCMLDGGDYNHCQDKLLKNNILFDVVDIFERSPQGYSQFASKSTLKPFAHCKRDNLSTGQVRVNDKKELSYFVR